MNARSESGGIWISIDGTDGVGKTLLANHLVNIMGNSILVPEFSDGLVGRFLRSAVAENPHFISESLMEQSLLFLADFFRIYDANIRSSLNRGLTVISDRGYVSKYVYQFIVLASRFDEREVRALLDAAFAFIAPPELTLFLTCEESAQTLRLFRRDGQCDTNRIGFIRKANQEYKVYLANHPLRYHHIDQSQDTQLDALFNMAEAFVKDYIGAASLKDLRSQ